MNSGLFEVSCKADINSRNLKTLENRVAVLEELIQEVQPYLDSAGQLAVQKLLAQVISIRFFTIIPSLI